jgi:hypothetical protein
MIIQGQNIPQEAIQSKSETTFEQEPSEVLSQLDWEDEHEQDLKRRSQLTELRNKSVEEQGHSQLSVKSTNPEPKQLSINAEDPDQQL